jgi:hypothetical protein
MQSEKSISQLREEHRCFGSGSKPCAFFGFDNDKELENKIYDFIDIEGKDWEYSQDSWDALIDFFKKENIYNVSFSGQIGIMFHKL